MELFKSAIGKQVGAGVKAYEAGESVEKAIRPDELRVAYSSAWTSTALLFAKETFNAVTSARKDFTEQELKAWEKAVLDYLKKEGSTRIKLITQTTRDWINAIIEFGVEAGWGTDKVAREIRKRWTDIEDFRAERIARTEIIGASNLGSREGALSTGLDLVAIWLSTDDKRTRRLSSTRRPRRGRGADHVRMNGERKEMNDRYSNGLLFPGEPGGQADEVINCRCTEIYEVRG